MKASLKLEAIGHNIVGQMRLYSSIIDEVISDRFGRLIFGSQDEWKRWGVWEVFANGKTRQIYGRTDYSRSNKAGSRGVMIWYELESGSHYFVKSPKSWKSTDEFMCHVTEDGEIVKE